MTQSTSEIRLVNRNTGAVQELPETGGFITATYASDLHLDIPASQILGKMRVGDDLIINLANGGQIIVRDFFAFDRVGDVLVDHQVAVILETSADDASESGSASATNTGSKSGMGLGALAGGLALAGMAGGGSGPNSDNDSDDDSDGGHDLAPLMQPNPAPTNQPNPAPTVQPNPTPTIQPDPTPTIQPDPTPAAQPDPTPAMQPDPAPAMQPDPTPTMQPDPTPTMQLDQTPNQVTPNQVIPNQVTVQLTAAERAMQTINAYNGNNTPPTLTDYLNAGIDGVTDTNLEEVNAQLKDSTETLTTTAVQMLVARVNALAKINAYDGTEDTTAPTTEDYAAADLNGITSDRTGVANMLLAAANLERDADEAITAAQLQHILDIVQDMEYVLGVLPPPTALTVTTGSYLIRIDIDDDGSPDQFVYVETDADGAPTSITYDFDNDGTMDRRDRFTMNAGKSRLEAAIDLDDDGTPEWTETYTENSAGHRIRTELHTDDDGSPDQIETYTMNAAGVRLAAEFDTDADGTADRRETYVRNAQGKRVRTEYDDDADGTTDRSEAPGVRQHVTMAQRATAALAKINAYRKDSSNDEPTLKDYRYAGVTGVTADNIDGLNSQVANAPKTDGPLTAQAIENLISAANDAQTEQPDDMQTEQPGITQSKQPDDMQTEQPDDMQTEQPGITQSKQPGITQSKQPDDMQTEQPDDMQTEQPDDMQTEQPEDNPNPAANTALETIKAWDGSNTAPTLADYLTIGVSGVSGTRLALLNALLQSANTSNNVPFSTEFLQNLVDALADMANAPNVLPPMATSTPATVFRDANSYDLGIDHNGDGTAEWVVTVEITAHQRILTYRDADGTTARTETHTLNSDGVRIQTTIDGADSNANGTLESTEFHDGTADLTRLDTDADGTPDQTFVLAAKPTPDQPQITIEDKKPVIASTEFDTNHDGTTDRIEYDDGSASAGATATANDGTTDRTEVFQIITDDGLVLTDADNDGVVELVQVGANAMAELRGQDYEAHGVTKSLRGITDIRLDESQPSELTLNAASMHGTFALQAGPGNTPITDYQLVIRGGPDDTVNLTDGVTIGNGNGNLNAGVDWVLRDAVDANGNPGADGTADTVTLGTGDDATTFAIYDARVDGVTFGSALIQQGVTVRLQATLDALAKINAWNGSNAAPEVQDYLDAGVTGVTTANLKSINAAVETQRNDNLATEAIQQLVTDVALAKINAHADGDTDNNVPTLQDYTNAGITSVTPDNLATVNARVALQANDHLSVPQIQAQVAIAMVLLNINAYDGNNTAPTVQDYLDVGITSVNQGNLAKVNTAVKDSTNDNLSAADIESLVTQVGALTKINAYDADTANALKTPTPQDYETIGVTGVYAITDSTGATVSNLNELNRRVHQQQNELTNDAIQQLVTDIALAKINAHADGDTGDTVPIIQDYTNAGITGVTPDNLAAVNARVATQSNPNLSMPQIQAQVAWVIALAKINAWDGSNAEPTVQDYAAIGITAVNQANLAKVNAAIRASDNDHLSVANIEPLVTKAVALAKINDYNADTATIQQMPTVVDFNNAGVTGVYAITDGAGVTVSNLPELNRRVHQAQNELTVDAIQQLVTDVALAKLNAFNNGDTGNEVPVLQDYTNAGITAVTTDNLAAVNDRIAAQTETNLSMQQIQAQVEWVIALAKINAWDGSNAEPAVQDYENISVTGVTNNNLAAVNAQVAAQTDDNLSMLQIQAQVNKVIALAKINAWDGSNAEPTLTDYTNAEVTGVTDGAQGNLAELNALVKAADNDNLTATDIEALLVTANALQKINAWNGNNTAPEVQDYTQAEVTGVTAANLESINAAVANQRNDLLDTDAIQQLVADVALRKINAHEHDDTGSKLPTLQDYTNAGITGVTPDNLATVNARVAIQINDHLSVMQIQAQVAIANVLVRINAWDGSDPAPSLADYLYIGVIGITGGSTSGSPGNLARVNAEVRDSANDHLSVADIESLVAKVDALAKINAYADGGSGNSRGAGIAVPTLQDYTNAGITGVTTDNLAAVNARVRMQTDDNLSVQQIQAQANTVIALAKINAYDGSNAEPTLQDYTDAGVSGASQDNLDKLNAEVKDSSNNNLTVADIESLITQVDAQAKINAYDADTSNAQQTPTLLDYDNAGVTGVYTITDSTGVTVTNLNNLNQRVHQQQGELTVDAIQQLVTDIALQKINNHQSGDTDNNKVPTIQDYINAGVTGVTTNNLAEVNARVSGQTDVYLSAMQIQAQVESVREVAKADALAKINAYDADTANAQQTPTVQDYLDAFVTGVYEFTDETGITLTNLTELNRRVDLEQTDLTTNAIQQLVTTIALVKINAHADDDTGNAIPLTQDYANAGITGVTTDLLAAVNARLAGLTAVYLSVPQIQAQANTVIALAKINAWDGTNAEPTLADYTNAGVTGVTDGAQGNLNELNAVVKASRNDDLTATDIEALLTIANALQKINAYDGSNAVPEVQDYTNAEVTGVTPANLEAVNAAVINQRNDLLTTENIQQLVADIALRKINDHQTDDTDNKVPTLQDYNNAGITGVTTDNLTAVNARVAMQTNDHLSTMQIQAQVVIATAYLKINAYDGSNDAPTLQDYENIGVRGVSGASGGNQGNLAKLNAAVKDSPNDDLSVADIESLLTQVDALIKINAHDPNSINANQTPTLMDYINAGVTGVYAITDASGATVTNLNELNRRVHLQQGEQTVQTIQQLLKSIALEKINAHENGDTGNNVPTPQDYANAGATGVTATNLAGVNSQVAGSALNPLTPRHINDFVDKTDTALWDINAYGGPDSVIVPSAKDYANAGFTKVTDANLPGVNSRVAKAVSNPLTQSDIDGFVAAAISDSRNLVNAYNGSNAEPTVHDYTNAGFTDVTTQYLAGVNFHLAVRNALQNQNSNDPVSLNEINLFIAKVAAAMITINDYLKERSSYAVAPMVEDYANAGVIGVSALNLNAVNARVYSSFVPNEHDIKEQDRQNTLAFSQVQALVNSVRKPALDKINAYDGNNGAPTLEDYATGGFTGVTAANLDRINYQVARSPNDSLELADIAGFVLAITAAQAKINAHDPNSISAQQTPTLEDYIIAGIKGVTSLNLARVNEQVADSPDTDLSTNDIQMLIDALAIINAYEIFDTGNSGHTEIRVPTIQDYQAADVEGVTNQNIVGLNDQVANSPDANLTTSELQALVALQNAYLDALQKLYEYERGDTGDAVPGLDDYRTAGIERVTAENIDAVNTWVANSPSNYRLPENIQALVALQRINDHQSSDSGDAVPVLADYHAAGVDRVTAGNLKGVNTRVAASPDTDLTVPEISALVALQRINAHETGDTGDAVPDLLDYQAAGVAGVMAGNLDVVNALVSASLDTDLTAAELQTLVILNKINTTTRSSEVSAVPVLADYVALGVTGITAGMLNTVNALVVGSNHSELRNGFTPDTLQHLVDAAANLEQVFGVLPATSATTVNVDASDLYYIRTPYNPGGNTVRISGGIVRISQNNAGAATSISYDFDTDHIIDRREVFTLDANNHRTRTAIFDTDTNADGTLGGVGDTPYRVETYEVNAQGHRIKTQFFDSDDNNDGTQGGSGDTPYRVEIHEVNAQGHRIKTTVYDSDDNNDGTVGGIADRPVVIESYSLDGAAQRTRIEFDTDANGSPDRIETFIHDNLGNVIEYRFDNDADSTTDTIEKHQISGNGAGHRVRTTFDFNGDGTADRIETYSLNNLGQRTRVEIDDLTHRLETRTVPLEPTEPNAGTFTQKTRVFVANGPDGTTDAVEDYQYNGRGKVTRAELDHDNDGTLEEIRTNDYNDQGLLARQVIVSDNGGGIGGNRVDDGTVDTRDTYTFSYDRQGLLTQEIHDPDRWDLHSGENNLVRRSRVTREYNSEGLVTKIRTDTNRDGTAEDTSTFSYNPEGGSPVRELLEGLLSKTSLPLNNVYRREVEERDLVGDTLPNGLIPRIANGVPEARTLKEWDSAGRLISEFEDYDGDGNYNNIKTNTYNEQGRRIRRSTWSILDDSGTGGENNFLYYENDREPDTITGRATDKNGDGTLDLYEEWGFDEEVDEDGNFVKLIRTHTYKDNNLDGVWDEIGFTIRGTKLLSPTHIGWKIYQIFIRNLERGEDLHAETIEAVLTDLETDGITDGPIDANGTPDGTIDYIDVMATHHFTLDQSEYSVTRSQRIDPDNLRLGSENVTITKSVAGLDDIRLAAGGSSQLTLLADVVKASAGADSTHEILITGGTDDTVNLLGDATGVFVGRDNNSDGTIDLVTRGTGDDQTSYKIYETLDKAQVDADSVLGLVLIEDGVMVNASHIRLRDEEPAQQEPSAQLDLYAELVRKIVDSDTADEILITGGAADTVNLLGDATGVFFARDDNNNGHTDSETRGTGDEQVTYDIYEAFFRTHTDAESKSVTVLIAEDVMVEIGFIRFGDGEASTLNLHTETFKMYIDSHTTEEILIQGGTDDTAYLFGDTAGVFVGRDRDRDGTIDTLTRGIGDTKRTYQIFEAQSHAGGKIGTVLIEDGVTVIASHIHLRDEEQSQPGEPSQPEEPAQPGPPGEQEPPAEQEPSAEQEPPAQIGLRAGVVRKIVDSNTADEILITGGTADTVNLLSGSNGVFVGRDNNRDGTIDTETRGTGSSETTYKIYENRTDASNVSGIVLIENDVMVNAGHIRLRDEGQSQPGKPAQPGPPAEVDLYAEVVRQIVYTDTADEILVTGGTADTVKLIGDPSGLFLRRDDDNDGITDTLTRGTGDDEITYNIYEARAYDDSVLGTILIEEDVMVDASTIRMSDRGLSDLPLSVELFKTIIESDIADEILIQGESDDLVRLVIDSVGYYRTKDDNNDGTPDTVTRGTGDDEKTYEVYDAVNDDGSNIAQVLIESDIAVHFVFAQ